MSVSHPNFCPTCGHRLYQHTAEGCTHSDQSRIDILDLMRGNHWYSGVFKNCGCGWFNPDTAKPWDGWLKHLVEEQNKVVHIEPCLCKRPHPLMVGAS